VLPDGAFSAKLPNEHPHQALEIEMRLRGTILHCNLRTNFITSTL